VKSYKLFNPLKKQKINKVHDFIKTLVDSDQQHICFYNDYSGFFSFPFRYSDNISYSYDDGRFHNLLTLMKSDVYLTMTAFKEMNSTFHWDLIEHFEERSLTEQNPIVQSYILFLLSNLSDADDFQMSRYSKDNLEIVEQKIEKLDSFYAGKVGLHHNSLPAESFVVSYETVIPNRNGILISKQKRKMPLIISSDGYHVYYNEK